MTSFPMKLPDYVCKFMYATTITTYIQQVQNIRAENTSEKFKDGLKAVSSRQPRHKNNQKKKYKGPVNNSHHQQVYNSIKAKLTPHEHFATRNQRIEGTQDRYPPTTGRGGEGCRGGVNGSPQPHSMAVDISQESRTQQWCVCGKQRVKFTLNME